MTEKEKEIYTDRLNRLCREAAEELARIGIHPSDRIFDIAVNIRAKKRLGCCRKVTRNGIEGYEIEISSLLRDKDDRTVKSIVFHELLHTCSGCFNHGVKWKEYAGRVGEEYGCHITCRADYSALELCTPEEERRYRYCIKCAACGKESYRFKRTKVTEHPGLYRCRVCGGELEVTKL